MFDDIISKKKKEVYEVETETVDYFDVSERTIMRRVKDFGISKRQK